MLLPVDLLVSEIAIHYHVSLHIENSLEKDYKINVIEYVALLIKI